MKFFTSAKTIHAVMVIVVFASIIAFHAHSTGMTGQTRMNGAGCTCHGSSSAAVSVQITGPDTLQPGQTGQYSLTISGGPLVRGGTNIAASAGSLIAAAGLKLQSGELTHTAPATPSANKVTFQFSYQAPSTASVCTLFANGNSVNFNNSSSGDQWNFAPEKIIKVMAVTPVELTSFAAVNINGAVELKWSTASEKNNRGFSISRSTDKVNWKNIGFVQGQGECACITGYSFIDKQPLATMVYYRLEQIDYNGSKNAYEIELSHNTGLTNSTRLMQNYPNPFNPSTKISYQLNKGGNVSLKIYNAIGKEVALLVDEVQPAGSYSINFNAESLPSGIYYSKLTSDRFSEVKKMILLR